MSREAIRKSATPDIAREEFASFLGRLDRNGRTLVFHDSDADGVTAGVVLEAALGRLGFASTVRIAPGRERDAWSTKNRALIAGHAPDALFLLDLGSRDEPLIDRGEMCLIDHHHPDGTPPGALLISGFNWRPIPNTSLMVYDLCSPIVQVDDLDWIAAVGVLSDLGEKAPFPLLESVKRKHRMSHLKEVTALVNAARRASDYRPETAARALMSHRSPADLIASESTDVEWMRGAREEVKSEMAIAKKAAPKFSGNVALILVRSTCQVHPVIAQIWRTRLPKYIVIVANDGYLPGRVNFSARSAEGVNLLEFLRGIDLGEGEGSYARGHEQATGGSLPIERWNLLLEKLGFIP